MKQALEERIRDIIDFAKDKKNTISYNIVLDILKEKGVFTEEEILYAIGRLGEEGIAIAPEQEEEYPSAEMNSENFIPAEVNIGQKPINVYNLMERLENEEINLFPDFQRKWNLWTLEQQSRLIESLMLKIPIPAFYFNAANEDRWVVIDGLQRLTAFLNFLVGVPGENPDVREKKKLEGLQYLKDFNGCMFDDLPRQYVRRIKETPLIVYTVEKGTPDAIVYNIFQRINTGGIVLNSQEIRQALYQGSSTVLIERLAGSDEFLAATQKAVRTERMEDREFITRFLAFTELDYKKEYFGNIDSFLIKAMKLVNTYEKADLDRLEKSFRKIMKYCADIFGRYAFRKYNEEWHRGPINKALFELWSVCFSELQGEQLEKLLMQKELFLKRFGELQKDRDFVSALKAGDIYSVGRRIEMARKMLKELL